MLSVLAECAHRLDCTHSACRSFVCYLHLQHNTTGTLPFTRTLAKFMDDTIGGFGFLEKSSADKKNEPHAFSIYNVGGNELWKYKTLLTYETNGDWIPATSDPLWGKGITVWKKLEDGSFDRPTLETFTAELNRQVALAVDDPEITGFKAKRNARGDGDAGVSTLQLMRQSRNKIEKFLKSQPVDDHKDCITAFEKYFEENVPRDMADFSGLPHKPVFGRLPPFQTSSAAEKEGLSEDAIVMPGEDRPGAGGHPARCRPSP